MTLRQLFRDIHDDFVIHGRSITNAAFWALVVYRYGRWAMARRFKPFRWFCGKIYGLLKNFSHLMTGVLIERTTRIGKGFHVVHPGMVAIHPDVLIGDRVGVMHGVTLGTNMGNDVPVIGNDVFIGCNASVLGKVTIGDGARVAANSLVIANVPAGCVAMGVPAKNYPNMSLLRMKKPEPAAPPSPPAP